MKEIGKAIFESDENGLITLQCDKCKSRFKIECSHLSDEFEDKIYCAICGDENSLDTFYPEEVLEEVNKVAMMEAEQMINDMFNSIKSKYIKVETTPVNKVDSNLVFKDKDYDMENITVHCCEKKMALRSFDLIAGFYCSYCGRIIR